VTDAQGTRTLGYDNLLQFVSEEMEGLYHRVVAYGYETAPSVAGRLIGLSAGVPQTPGPDYEVGYGYDAKGTTTASATAGRRRWVIPIARQRTVLRPVTRGTP